MSWHLSPRGCQHLVLERDRIAKRWRIYRWTLCFQFSNWAPNCDAMPTAERMQPEGACR
jgi:hypothetical protein